MKSSQLSQLSSFCIIRAFLPVFQSIFNKVRLYMETPGIRSENDHIRLKGPEIENIPARSGGYCIAVHACVHNQLSMILLTMLST